MQSLQADVMAESEDILLLGLLFGDQLLHGEAEVLSFQHRLLQEFIAALYISHMMKEDAGFLESAFPNWDSIEGHKEVVQFVRGILKKSNDGQMMIDHVCRCFAEDMYTKLERGKHLDICLEHFCRDYRYSPLGFIRDFQKELGSEKFSKYLCIYPECNKPLDYILCQSKLIVINDIPDDMPDLNVRPQEITSKIIIDIHLHNDLNPVFIDDYLGFQITTKNPHSEINTDEDDSLLSFNRKVTLLQSENSLLKSRQILLSKLMHRLLKNLATNKVSIHAICLVQIPVCQSLHLFPVSLRCLSLPLCEICDEEVCQQLGEVLKQMHNLTYLDLRCNVMGQFGIHIAQALGCNAHSKIRYLDLSQNDFPVQVSSVLLKALTGQTQLQELVLSANNLSGCVGNLMQSPSPPLEVVQMSLCSLSADDILSISSAIEQGKLPQIEYLCISTNQLSESVLEPLLQSVETLEKRHAASELTLQISRFNNVSEDFLNEWKVKLHNVLV